MTGTPRMRAACSAATIRARSARSPIARTARARGCPTSCRTVAPPRRPAFDLAEQIVDRCNRRDRARSAPAISAGIGDRPSRRASAWLAAALAGDHIGRDGPGLPAKPRKVVRGGNCHRDPAHGRHRPAQSAQVRGWRRVQHVACLHDGGASRGPSPVSNHRSCPSAIGTIRMSENRIAPSMPKRRIG